MKTAQWGGSSGIHQLVDLYLCPVGAVDDLIKNDLISAWFDRHMAFFGGIVMVMD